MGMSRVVLHIDRLVLNGIDRHDADAVAAGVRAELQRVLSRPGAAAQVATAGDQSRLRGAQVQVEHGVAGGELGTAVGQGIARQVTP